MRRLGGALVAVILAMTPLLRWQCERGCVDPAPAALVDHCEHGRGESAAADASSTVSAAHDCSSHSLDDAVTAGPRTLAVHTAPASEILFATTRLSRVLPARIASSAGPPGASQVPLRI